MRQTAGNTNVTKNNERIFGIYETHLRSQNMKEYADTATRLGAWLSDSKAYYAAARPKVCSTRLIVDLLMTAQMTLRQVVGHSLDPQIPFKPSHFLDHPLTANYVRLVRTLAPFRDEFGEPQLRESVTQLLRSVEGIPSPAMSRTPPQSASTDTSSQDPVPQNLAKEKKLPGFTHSPELSASRQSQNTQQDLRLPQARTGESSTVVSEASKVRKSLSPDIVFLGTFKKNNSELISQDSFLPGSLRSNQPPHDVTKSAGKIKSKKKKKIDLASFVQSDLQDFERKQAQMQGRSSLTTTFIKKEPEAEQLPSTADHGQHSLDAMHSSRVNVVESPSIRPHSDVPAHRDIPLPGSTSEQSSQASSEAVKPPEPRIPSQRSTSLSRASLPEPSFTSNPRSQLAGPVHKDPSSSSQTPQLPQGLGKTATGPLESTDQVLHTMSSTDLVADTLGGRGTENSSDPQTRHKCFRELVLPEPKSAQLPAVKELTKDEGSVAMQSTGAPLMVKSLFVSGDSDLGRLFKWYEEYKLAKFSPADDPKDVEMPSQHGQEEINCAVGLTDDLACLDLQAQVPASERSLRILAIARGREEETCSEFTFETVKFDMEPLQQWVTRSTKRLRGLVSSYCLSLGCYSASELERLARLQLDAIPVDADAILTSAVRSLPSTWPQDGGLTINVNFEGARKDLPLSPPLIVTGDGFVDVSEFIVLGPNRLRLLQEDKDFSTYVFVLHAHNPTLNQLQEVVGHRRKEIEWKDWLVEIARPLSIGAPKHAQFLPDGPS
ncbi:hypothetical protein AN958_04175 [Leucoagaricus sp. SymC.cos]|nr:hypothetical protein AN958_04175 [Leucoagaricus sp. SymC.cos]